MYNPLTEQIEELTSKTVGQLRYPGKEKVVRLDDAIEALENLETKLWGMYQNEISKISALRDDMAKMGAGFSASVERS